MITVATAEMMLEAHSIARDLEASVDRAITQALVRGERATQYKFPGSASQSVADALAERYRLNGWKVQVKTEERRKDTDALWLEIALPEVTSRSTR